MTVKLQGKIIGKNREVYTKNIRSKSDSFNFNNGTYYVDPDSVVFAIYKPIWGLGFIKAPLKLLYYYEDVPKPLPARIDYTDGPAATEEEAKKKKKPILNAIGIKSQELKVIFTPKLYQIIAMVKDLKRDLILYICIGLGLMNLYLVWKIGDISTTVDLLQQNLEAIYNNSLQPTPSNPPSTIGSSGPGGNTPTDIGVN